MKRCVEIGPMGIVVCLGLAFLGGCPPLDNRVDTPEKYTDLDLVYAHDPASSQFEFACTDCHGDRLEEISALGELKALHAVMPERLPDGENRCFKCHPNGADLAFRASNYLRKDVFEVAGCASTFCHGANGPVPLYAINLD